MEGWPIQNGDVRLFLEMKGDFVEAVCASYSGQDIEKAPKVTTSPGQSIAAHVHLPENGKMSDAISRVLNWQSVVSGIQIFDIDFDDYEIRYRAESDDEEDKIHVSSFSSPSQEALNFECDFEQIGRAFCVDRISDERIESTSHYRDARLALEAGRNIDAYNGMYLFLETRYCNGKTGTARQVEELLKSRAFLSSLNNAISEMPQGTRKCPKLAKVFDKSSTQKEQVKSIVELRGHLRHHSLKSPHRWDPNQQHEYRAAAIFLGAVVGHIVINESLSDIYSVPALKRFRELSVSSGNEIKLTVKCNRLEQKRWLSLDMSYPSTVVSSKLCLATVRNALQACDEDGQIADTVRISADASRTKLEVFSVELGVWAYSKERALKLNQATENIVCCQFERSSSGSVFYETFDIRIDIAILDIRAAWAILLRVLDRIEKIDPTTRIMRLKLFLNATSIPFVNYAVGAQVKN